MASLSHRISRVAAGCFLLATLTAIASFSQQTTEISATPSSLSFADTYVGKSAGSKVITINNLTTSGQVIINTIGFSCPGGYGLASGVAPFTMSQSQKITHYSVFFQPTTAQAYNCNFVVTLTDGTFLNVPLTGNGLSTTASSSLSKTALSFPNQPVGTTSPGQTVTITNNGTANLTLKTITLSPLTFSTSAVTLPTTIAANSSLSLSVFYNPNQVTSETGALDLTYNEVPDNGVTLTGNGSTATSLVISTSPTLPQATKTSAYQATLVAAGGTGSYTWSVSLGSLPSGLSLSSAGVISGTLASTVNTGTYTFTIMATDTSTNATASTVFSLGVFANLGDNCNDIQFNVPDTTTPMVALTDLATGSYQGSQGGLYPNGSNVRPASHDSDGRAIAQTIQPLDSNGNPSSTGKYVLLAVGESTAENEFNRFLPIANADPAKNSNLVLVNGGQGGATPNQFTSTSSVYWLATLNNYLPQNGVSPNQVVAAWIEDTDGIATGTFPTDIANLQTEYETMMRTMHILFPNLKLVYFSSRVYGGYSVGVAAAPNPEPYAYEVGFAVKNVIADQLNGVNNLNYNPNLGPVVAPWMSWGPYYWSNGMLGRNDGLEWDCEDFSSDGTHPSSTYGQLKVATPLLAFLKTDDTAAPWFLAPNLNLSSTAGDMQSGNTGTTLPSALTVLASNLNSGNPISGVSVTFKDNGAGGTFGTPVGVTGTDGTASSTYTLPAAAQTVNISASATGYSSATFTETATAKALSGLSGDGQTGNAGTTLPVALTVFASSSGNAVQGVTVTFSDGGAGGTLGSPTGVTGSDGTVATTYTLPATAKSITITASASGYTPATFGETSNAPSQVLTAAAGNNQTGTVGTILPVALMVTATSGGNPAQGVTVSFTDGGAGGTFGTPMGTTGSNGMVSTTYTLPPTAQTVTITASSSGYTSASFSETATAPVLVLTPTAGNNQHGGTGTTLPTALTVLATSNGSPVQGVSVTFSDGGAGGAFTNSIVTTGTNGTASTTYTLPSTAQTVTVTATSSGFTSAIFTETADVDALTPTAGNNQSGGVGSTLPASLTVTATSEGNPVQGVSVVFTDGGAGGMFGNPVVTTGTDGTASTTYTLPPNAQTVTITASGSGYTAATFTETAAVWALSATGGNNQSGMVNVVLPTALTVTATSNGVAVSGVSVAFSDGGAGGSFGTPVAVTGSTGTASTTYTPGTVGVITITAASSGYTSATFTETGTPTVTSLSDVSGQKQTGAVGTALPLPIVMKAKNASGKAVSGAPITFSDGGLGGSFSPNPAITGSNGQASTTYTLPTVAKAITVTGADGSVSVRTSETSVAGPATALSIVSGNNQAALPSKPLPKKLFVSVTDHYGNGISGVTITFTDNGAGGTFSTTTPVTGSNGQASTSYTTGSKAGTVTISASTSTLGPVNFTETVK